MRISRRQRRFAEDRPWRVWRRSFEVVGSLVGISLGVAAALADGWTWPGILYVPLCGGAGWVLGILLAVVTGWFVLGPLYHHQAVENGHPFQIGDEVEILAGQYRGMRGRVYERGQFDRSRVWLGEEAARDFRDLFEPTEIVRVPPGDADRAKGE